MTEAGRVTLRTVVEGGMHGLRAGVTARETAASALVTARVLIVIAGPQKDVIGNVRVVAAEEAVVMLTDAPFPCARDVAMALDAILSTRYDTLRAREDASKDCPSPVAAAEVTILETVWSSVAVTAAGRTAVRLLTPSAPTGVAREMTCEMPAAIDDASGVVSIEAPTPPLDCDAALAEELTVESARRAEAAVDNVAASTEP